MLEPLSPDPQLRKQIEQSVHAESHMCWTCRSCASECPVNIATNRLQPVKVVWMANLGLVAELLNMPEIWYCQSCNRCNQVCPMTVKPAAIIRHCRQEALRRKIVSNDRLRQYNELYGRFQRARWQMASCCRGKNDVSLSQSDWKAWLNTPVRPGCGAVKHAQLFAQSKALKKAMADTHTNACLTCGECSSACPVFYERGVFDPVWIFRMVNLGLIPELLASPAIWLCIGCQRCSDACTQGVRGHQIIEHLKQLAVDEGFVENTFPLSWREFQQALYCLLLNDIDTLFGFQKSAAGTGDA
jgi:heterodisulfide reductase subunit C